MEKIKPEDVGGSIHADTIVVLPVYKRKAHVHPDVLKSIRTAYILGLLASNPYELTLDQIKHAFEDDINMSGEYISGILEYFHRNGLAFYDNKITKITEKGKLYAEGLYYGKKFKLLEEGIDIIQREVLKIQPQQLARNTDPLSHEEYKKIFENKIKEMPERVTTSLTSLIMARKHQSKKSKLVFKTPEEIHRELSLPIFDVRRALFELLYDISISRRDIGENVFVEEDDIGIIKQTERDNNIYYYIKDEVSRVYQKQ